jgi:hypothetical protein
MTNDAIRDSATLARPPLNATGKNKSSNDETILACRAQILRREFPRVLDPIRVLR